MDCIFCKLANKEIPTEVVYEDEFVFAFNDMSPQAPVHILFIPKKHLDSAQEVEDQDVIISHIFTAMRKVARDQGVDKAGYRVITNVGKDAGQTVFHMHFHLLAGKKLKERFN